MSRSAASNTVATFFAVLLSCWASNSAFAFELPPTDRAALLAKQGDLQGALAAAQTAAKNNPTDWLALASLSYHSWQMGDNASAVRAGMDAVKHNPRSVIALTNLARMEEALGAQRDALTTYERLVQVAPENQAGHLGIARCYISADNRQKALVILEQMIEQDSRSFNWYNEVTETCLRINEPALALKSACKSATVSSLSNDISLAQTQRLLALLMSGSRDSQVHALAKEVFASAKPTRYEIYVRAAEALCPSGCPGDAEPILESAINNLKGSDDSEGFYKLGRVFQNKALYVSFDKAKYSQWQALARSAYRTAVSMTPYQARYHTALASTLEPQSEGMKSALQTAAKLDSFDSLTARLLTLANEKRGFCPTKVRFSASGINCTCHFAKIEQELQKGSGVAFVSIRRSEPYEGVMLIEEQGDTAENVLNKCKETLTGGPSTKLFESIKMNVISRQPVEGIAEAVCIAQNAVVGDPLLFFEGLTVPAPTLPTPETILPRAISAKKKPHAQ